MSISLYNGNNTIIFNNGSYQSDMPITTGQSWSTPTRAIDTLYTNSTSKTIFVNITTSHRDTASSAGGIYVDGVLLSKIGVFNSPSTGGNNKYGAFFFVKPGSTYKIATLGAEVGNIGLEIWNWSELS